MTILVTSGCSFSDPTSAFTTWPLQLATSLNDCHSIHLGRASQGNGIISRKLIHTVYELLKQHDASDLLVGVMWSAPVRYDFYNENPLYKNIKPEFSTIENPTGFVNDDKNWIIFNHHWEDTINCQLYYKNFHDPIFGQLVTMEHILRTQWFLEKHNIKYFMSTYTNEVFSEMFIHHPEIEYLYKQINFNTFLPTEGQFEWCKKYSNLELPKNLHPSTEQNKKFTDEVIITFLKEKKYI